ncbi:MAG: hypothetical protein ACK52I_04495 [Pseudomonadota bacterium]|jgi:hypothetical protein
MQARQSPKSVLQNAGGGSRAKLRQLQLEWLEWLSERTGDTLTAIARRAEKNPGTLTELRNGEKDRVLSDATVADIARRYQVPGPLEFRTLPGFAEDAVPYQADPQRRNATTDEWEMRSNVLEALGIQAGDTLEVDLSRLPHDGDIVSAQIFTGPMSARTVFRLYREIGRFSFLATAFHDQRANMIEIAGMSDITIKGVVIAAHRRMAG